MRAIQKAMFAVFIFIGVFFSCSDKTKGETSPEELMEARKLFTKPDSIRTAEDKQLIIQIDQAMYGGEFIILKDFGTSAQFEIIGSKQKWIKKGLPGIYYEVMKQNVERSNKDLLDSIRYKKQLIIDLFHAKQEEQTNLKKSL